jgi:hypothetical protein
MACSSSKKDIRREALEVMIRIIQKEKLELEQLKDLSIVELLRQVGVKMGNVIFI